MSARITFCGGAGSVTGANFLLETDSTKLLVDCGLEQRERACNPENYAPFSYKPSEIHALFVTHAHADHIGRIPRLVAQGFKGVIYSTGGTRDLAELMFADAISIMQSVDAHCEPLYTLLDVEKTMSLWKTHEYHESFSLNDITVDFLDAGHILGSTMVRFARAGEQLIFSGDLGNTPEPLLRATESVAGARYIIMESVYGDRVHEERANRHDRLKEIIEMNRARNGVLLIPSFSLERTQVLLAEMNQLVESKTISPFTVFLDSPLSIRATEVYARYREYLNDEIQNHWRAGDNPFAFEGLTLTPRAQQSEAIHNAPNPKVIIAGAGMSHGGRIREHERTYLGDASTTVLFVGYQTPGSLGRRLQEGAKKIQIDKDWYPVKAQMLTLSGYSGHADREQLLSFLEPAVPTLKEVFIAMGEPKASLFFAQRAHDFLGVNATVPTQGESFEIEW